MFFCYENTLTYPIHISDQKFENSMDLLFISSHYVCIKDFDKFMFSKTKNKNKKYFCKSCLQCFSSKNVLTEYKKVCLKMNGEQAVKLEKGTIEFKNYCQQMPVPFKFYAGFECILESVESNAGSCTISIKITFLVVFFTNLFVSIINLVNQLFLTEVKMLLINLLNLFLKSTNTVKK